MLTTGSSEHAADVFEGHRARVILNALERGHRSFVELTDSSRVEKSRTLHNVLWDKNYQELVEALDGMPGVEHHEVQGLELWVFDEVFALRLKTFSSGHQISNVPTLQQAAVQQGLALGDTLPPRHHVTVGPLIASDFGSPDGYWMARYSGKRRNPEWVMDLSDLAAGAGGSAVTVPTLPYQPGPTIGVASKRSAQEAKEQS